MQCLVVAKRYTPVAPCSVISFTWTSTRDGFLQVVVMLGIVTMVTPKCGVMHVPIGHECNQAQ